MIALLLNSGLGSRMGDETREHPKCMTVIGHHRRQAPALATLGDSRESLSLVGHSSDLGHAPGETIVSWQLKCLEAVGVTEAVVTTGHLSDMLESYLLSLDTPIRFHFVHNPRYRETNYIYSVHLARELLAGRDVISLHGDLVMHPEVMQRLAASPVSAVTVDSTLPLPEKDFKGRVADGMLCEVGVNVFGPDCIELQPAYLLKSAQTDRWLREIAAFVSAGNDRVYAENAFNAAWREIPIRPLDVQGLLCAEIDNQADKEQVSQRFAKECQA